MALGTFVAPIRVLNVGFVTTGDLAGIVPVLTNDCGLLCRSRTGPVLYL